MSLDAIANAPPPLMDEEVDNFIHQCPSCIHITAGDFCLDLTCPHSHLVNQVAFHIFASDFRDTIQNQGLYTHPEPLDPIFLVQDRLTWAIYKHFKVIRNAYNTKVLRPEKLEETEDCLCKASRSSRKTRVCQPI